MLAMLKLPELRLTRPLVPGSCGEPYGWSTERLLAMAGEWVPTGYALVCSRSARLEWLLDAGTELPAISYPPTTAGFPNTEYELATVPTNGRPTGFRPPYDPSLPRQKRHQAVNLRPSQAKRPGKRLM